MHTFSVMFYINKLGFHFTEVDHDCLPGNAKLKASKVGQTFVMLVARQVDSEGMDGAQRYIVENFKYKDLEEAFSVPCDSGIFNYINNHGSSGKIDTLVNTARKQKLPIMTNKINLNYVQYIQKI